MDPALFPLLNLPERRSRRRQFCRLPALICLPHLNDGLACTVENLNETGARLRLASRALIAADFRILLPTVSIAYEARLLWRRNLDLGARILRRHDLQQPAAPGGAEA